jgi:hypothetical protein
VRRYIAFTLAVTAAATVLGGPTGAARTPSGPVLLIAPDVPNDVRAVASDTWERFVSAFDARRGCIRPVKLEHAWRFADRGAYDQETATIVLRVPGTAPNLRHTLVHEFAHHLETTCPAQRAMRRPFLVASGEDPETPWFSGTRWAEIPSERFAETVAVFVLDERPSHLRVSVSDDAVGAIERWATRTT